MDDLLTETMLPEPNAVGDILNDVIVVSIEEDSTFRADDPAWVDILRVLDGGDSARVAGVGDGYDVPRVAQALTMLGTCSASALASALDRAAEESIEAMLAGLAIGRMTEGMVEQALKVGNQLHDEAQLAAEQQLMQMLSKARPEFYWPWYVLGRCALESDAPLEATRLLDRAIALNADFGWSHFFKFRALIALGERNEAIGSLDTALRLIPTLRPTVAPDRLRLLSRITWTPAHAEVLTDLLVMGSPSQDVIQQLLSYFSGILLPGSLGGESASEACAEDVARILLDPGIVSAQDFRLLPIHYMAALAVGHVKPRLADDLLSAFERRMPDSLDLSRLPEMFGRVVRQATEGFLHAMYVRTWPKAPHITAFCLRVADLQYRVFRNAGVTRVMSEAATADVSSEALRDAETLRLLAYSDEQKWFEVLNIVRGRSTEAVASSPQFLKAYVSAMVAVTEGHDALMLKAAQQIMDVIDTTVKPAEVADSVSEKVLKLLRDGMRGLYDRAKAAATAGDQEEAVACWERGLTYCCDLVERFESMLVSGESASADSRYAEGEVLILTSPYLPQVLHYRGEQMLDLLETAWVPVALVDLAHTPIQSLQLRALKARAVIVQRQPATFEVVRFLAWCRLLGVRTIYDIDDQIFDSRISPLPLNDYGGRIGRDTHIHLQLDCAYFREAMARCDEVIVSTRPLRRQVEALLPSPRPVHVRRNMIGLPLRTARLESRVGKAATPRAADSPLEVFYGSGTKAHKAYFDETVLPALIGLLRSRKAVRVTLFGEFDVSDLPVDVVDRVTCERQMLEYPAYLARLAEADISIAPLNSNLVTDGKSELKWFEAACFGIPSVVSPTENYRDVLQDETHALFAETEAEWTEALVRLVDDAALRAQLVENSQTLIAQDYEISRTARPLAETLRLMPSSVSKLNRRRRLLVVNTYFRPQSIGGATRIAESYVQDLLTRHGDAYEVFVLCADAAHRTALPYGVTVLRQDGVTVLRCAVPQRDWADATDPLIEALTLQIVSDLGIDAAHVHSVQILTASVVDGLVKAGVPVVLSLHDGWWLSEHQFLVDDDGTAFLPKPDGSDLAETTCRRLSLRARLSRRATLARIIGQCRHRVAVSESFAEVYRQAGIANIETLENGVDLPSLAVRRPKSEPGAPLRIGFIGGLSAHKGYKLLEDVARSENLPNLEFVLVDHRHEQGYEREGRWGTSRVSYIGKTSQSRVAEVYERFDILAAPSIWPESYGLVAREARALGVPVIAGNRGDIGRGIKPGRDGWVVDVSDDSDLRALFLRLNDDPGCGRLHPAPPEVSTVQQAVDKLILLLEDVFV